MKPPRVFKKRTSKPIPQGAEIITYRGRRCARWTGRRGTFTVPLNTAGSRIVYESSVWWIGFEDAAGNWQEVPGYTDRTATDALKIERVKRAERGHVGVADPLEAHRRRPLAEHVTDFERHLCDKDNTPEHVALTVQRVQAILRGTKAESL